MRVSGFGIEKGKGVSGLCDAAGDQQLGQHMGRRAALASAAASAGCGSANCQRWRGRLGGALRGSARTGFNCCRSARSPGYSSSSSRAMGVVDEDVLEASISSSSIWKRSYHSVVVSCRKTRP